MIKSTIQVYFKPVLNSKIIPKGVQE